ncbi:MAG: recombination protein RecR, partial [Paracoccaceae bacterium]
MSGAKDIHDLIDLMAKLPGLGPRSARRTVLHMVRKKNYLLAPLADLMQQVAAS